MQQLSFNNVCSIAIDGLSPILWQRKDPAFVKVLGLWVKDVAEAHFEVVLVIELFLAQIIRKTTVVRTFFI